MKRAAVESVVKFDKSSDANVPKLVTFASGDIIPAGAKFTNFRNTEDGSHILTADTSRLSYVNRAQPQDLMLAVVNRTTGKARLVPLQSYHLAPALEPAAAAPEAEAARPTRDDVGRAFGLARWQKQHSRSQRLTVGSGAGSVTAALSAAVEHVAAADPEADAAAAPQAEAGLVPPQNAEAADPVGVYRREDVVPPRVWGQLGATDDQFREALAKHASTHEYIVRQTALWEESDEERYTLTMYAFYMLRLLRYMQGMKMKKVWKQLMIPAPVLEHMRETFMERSHQGWDRSDRLVDKLICYFMVVTLWIHNYTIDLNEIAGVTRIQVKKLLQYSAALGLTVAGQKATLRLPLKLRTAANSRRTKKVAAM